MGDLAKLTQKQMEEAMQRSCNEQLCRVMGNLTVEQAKELNRAVQRTVEEDS